MTRLIALTTAALLLAGGHALATETGKAAQTTSSTSGSRAEFTKDPRLDLSKAQERTIYQAVDKTAAQPAPSNMPMIVGAMVPGSMELKEFPAPVAQQVAAVKNLKYVRLQDDKVLLVDPTNRVVKGIITKAEGS